MGKLVNLPIADNIVFCDLIREEVKENELPHCYGYPGECRDCEVKRYLDRTNPK